MRISRPLNIFFVALAVILPARFTAAQDDDHSAHHRPADNRLLGHVTFPNSGNAAAQKPFLEGLALLHSFEYEEAVDAFHRAAKADSTFALPYWMEAFTNSKIIWGLE